MSAQEAILFIVGFAGVIGSVLKGFNSLKSEFDQAQKAVGEKYVKTKDLEEIAQHKNDVLGIGGILEKLKRQDEKFAHDLQAITCHDETLKKHSQIIEQEMQHDGRQDIEMRMILRALLAVLRSLEQKGINHTTTANIKEIEAYIWKTENK